MATNRKTKATPATSNVTSLIKPTPEQRRDIYSILMDVYNIDKGCYTGAETDESVAATLDITRWGWVTEVREMNFGPDGNEAEFVALAEIQSWILKADKEISEFKVHLREMETSREGAQKLMDQVQHLIGKKKKGS